MKKMITLISIVVLVNFYLLSKAIAWLDVERDYVVSIRSQQECDKAIILYNRLPIVERSVHLWFAMDRTKEAEELCDSSEKSWKTYENSKERYLNNNALILLYERYFKTKHEGS